MTEIPGLRVGKVATVVKWCGIEAASTVLLIRWLRRGACAAVLWKRLWRKAWSALLQVIDITELRVKLVATDATGKLNVVV